MYLTRSPSQSSALRKIQQDRPQLYTSLPKTNWIIETAATLLVHMHVSRERFQVRAAALPIVGTDISSR
jgi:hypothetical protein